jgi:ribosomal protein S12 methylthiotransferase
MSKIGTRGRASFVVLGCAKNQVEAETMSSRLAGMGWQLTADIPSASVIVVHTCGFLEAARKEAEGTIASLRRSSPRSKLVMTGCFAQYLGGKKPANVDALLGTGEFFRLPDVLDRIVNGEKTKKAEQASRSPGGFHDASLSRPLQREQLSAYLRISEGCNHRCSFCVIPQLRGNLKSRLPEEILKEAGDLLDRGVRELVLISQDTTDYGTDLPGRPPLTGLIRRLLALPKARWVRILYAYPSEVSDELIGLLAGEERLCRYLDMPLQHISDRILKSMKREWGEKPTRELLERLAKRVPGLSLRTTFIVGYPGETESDFLRTLALVKSGFFEHVGVFPYSPESRSPSSRLEGAVPVEVAEERQNRLLEAQSHVTQRRTRERLGRIIEVVIEKAPTGAWTARGQHQAPEVDGGVRLSFLPERAGFYPARVTGREGVDLTADLVDPARTLKTAGRRPLARARP